MQFLAAGTDGLKLEYPLLLLMQLLIAMLA
jgi:hypothetical protein